MSKPTDISEYAWKTATQLSHLIYCEVDDSGRPYIPADEILTIALAIDAATLAEREACAHEAEIVRHPRGKGNETADWLAGTCAAADAIRGRSAEVNTAHNKNSEE